MILVAILAAILDWPIKTWLKVILMYLIELLICKNPYFDTNFMKLSALEQKLWAFIGFGGHFGLKNA